MPLSVYLYGLLGSVFDGLLTGSIYGLMALGLTLIFRVTRIANFAYAEYVTYGIFAASAASAAAAGSVLGFVYGLAAALAVASTVSLLSDELAFKPLWRRGADSLTLLVASMGVGFILRYGLLGGLALGNKSTQAKLQAPGESLFTIGGIASFSTSHLFALASAIAVAGLLHYMFTRTRLGKAMRATASNPILARITGIDIFLVRRVTWLLAGAIAGLAAAVYAYHTYANPETGWTLLLWMFAAAIMGGFTFFGALVSGFILGLAESIMSQILQLTLGFGTEYGPVVALVALVIVLLYRPEGVIRLETHMLRRRA